MARKITRVCAGPLDPRIGTLNSGVFYAFVNGYDQPEVRGTRYEVEIALGLRRRPVERKTYTVTMMQGGDVAETEHTGATAAEAITKARDFWNIAGRPHAVVRDASKKNFVRR